MSSFNSSDLQELLSQSSTGAMTSPPLYDTMPTEYLAAYAICIRQAATASYERHLAVADALSRASRYSDKRPYYLGNNTMKLSRLATIQEMQEIPLRHPHMDDLNVIPVAHSGIISQKNRLEMTENSVGILPKYSCAEESSEDVKKTAPRCKKFNDMPKRPLSAYNIFFKEERNKILDSISTPDGYSSDNNSDSEDKSGSHLSHRNGLQSSSAKSNQKKRKPHGKIGFENLAKTIGARWKSLSRNRLAHYKSLAEEDKIRYKKEMKEYLEKEERDNLNQEHAIQKKEENQRRMKRLQQEKLLEEMERVAKHKRTIEAIMQRKSYYHEQRDHKKLKKETPVEDFSRSYLKQARLPNQKLSPSPANSPPSIFPVLYKQHDSEKSSVLARRMAKNSLLLRHAREVARLRSSLTKNK